ncbi:WD40-repeat-containing domain protein [Scheffersomyces xylosifermentans]|uniref:WD40-repeat-containing domain protein n=1 Tax=Scheffersomyces xylosifermentans TaxID=1304137 RepID=UPI00315D8591
MAGKKETKVSLASESKAESSSPVEVEAPKKDEKQSAFKRASDSSKPIQFRIMVGSYEHNLLCVSLIMDPKSEKEPIFQPIFHFQAHALSIKSMDIAKRYLVTGSNDEHIRIYDLQKRKELGHLLSHQGTITSLEFSKEISSDHPESTEKSGKWLLSGSEDGKIIIWRTKDWEAFSTLKGHTAKVNDLAIHPTGRVAISVSQDQTIRLWNLMTAKKAAVLKIKGKDHLGQSGEFVRWSVDGNYFVVGLLDQLFIYKTSTAKIVKKVKFSSTLMTLDMFKIEGKEWLVTGHGNGTIDFFNFEEQIVSSLAEKEDESKVWDSKAESLTPVYQLRGHTNRIKGFTYFNDPVETNGIPLLISVSSDGKIVVWNVSENVRDQVAIYDTGERLNCVAACAENVEKVETMKRRFNTVGEMNGVDDGAVSESEYETDGEEIKKIMLRGKKKGKKNKKRKVNITLE